MAQKTKIQWCDSTCNPTMGCDGCELWSAKVKTCYAGALHRRFGKSTKGYSPTFEQLTTWPGRMAEAASWRDLTGTMRSDKPWLNGLPRLIFVSDMSDSLSGAVTFEFLKEEVIDNVTSPQGQRHQWLWLSKRPQRMAEFSSWLAQQGISWPSNVWAGTSVTTQATTSRINHLLRIGGRSTVRFLSVEPQHEQINLSRWLPRLNWVIQGGESARKAAPFDLAWARDLIEQCRRHDVPYFLKQIGSAVTENGEPFAVEDHHDWDQWPEDIRVRQMPLVASILAAR